MISSSIPAFPVTLLHPGTKSCRYFILSLIFSRLTWINQSQSIRKKSARYFNLWSEGYFFFFLSYPFSQAMAVSCLAATRTDVDVIGLGRVARLLRISRCPFAVLVSRGANSGGGAFTVAVLLCYLRFLLCTSLHLLLLCSYLITPQNTFLISKLDQFKIKPNKKQSYVYV